MTASIEAGGLPWLESIRMTLYELHETQHLPHAILIDGAPGWGQNFVAASLVGRLLELEGSIQPDDCRSLAHPDLRWIDPDGAVIKIDAVRAAIEFSVSASDGGAKALVFADAHGLQMNSANALLKTLEEPNPGTFVILATEYSNRLLPTIRSRCQRFTIEAKRALVDPWLQQHGCAAEAASQLLFEAGNAPLAALSADGEPLPLIGPLLEAALIPKTASKVTPAELLEFEPADLLLRWLRYVVAQLGGQGRIDALKNCSKRSLIAFNQELLAVQRQILASNSVNIRLQLERLLGLWRTLSVPAM